MNEIARLNWEAELITAGCVQCPDCGGWIVPDEIDCPAHMLCRCER